LVVEQQQAGGVAGHLQRAVVAEVVERQVLNDVGGAGGRLQQAVVEDLAAVDRAGLQLQRRLPGRAVVDLDGAKLGAGRSEGDALPVCLSLSSSRLVASPVTFSVPSLLKLLSARFSMMLAVPEVASSRPLLKTLPPSIVLVCSSSVACPVALSSTWMVPSSVP